MKQIPTDSSTNKALDRALMLIDFLATKGIALNMSEITKFLSVNRATAQSIVNSLEVNNYVEKDPETGKYSLGYQMYHHGNMYRHKYPFLFAAEKHIKNVGDALNLKINVIVLKPHAVGLIILCKDISLIPTMVHGQILPAYASACGKLLLAYLDAEELAQTIDSTELTAFTSNTITDKTALLAQLQEFRAREYAYENEELVMKRACIAAPIRDMSGKVIAAVSFSAPMDRIDRNRAELTEQVIALGKTISSELGYSLLNF